MISSSGSFRRECWLLAWLLVAAAACGSATSEPIIRTSIPPNPSPSPDPSPGATASPPPTTIRISTPDLPSGLQGPPQFEDRFTVDTGWELGDFASGAASLLNERLVIVVRGPSNTLQAVSPVSTLTDFYVSVAAITEICADSDEFGLLARSTGADTHYRFMVTCEGDVRASRFSAGEEAALVPIVPAAAVIPGAPARNQLGLSAVGDRLQFYVNQIQVLEFTDRSLSAGGVGVIVRARGGAQTTVSFDDFQVWDLSIPAGD